PPLAICQVGHTHSASRISIRRTSDRGARQGQGKGKPKPGQAKARPSQSQAKAKPSQGQGQAKPSQSQPPSKAKPPGKGPSTGSTHHPALAQRPRRGHTGPPIGAPVGQAQGPLLGPHRATQ